MIRGVLIALALIGQAGYADPLAEMAGEWRGAGWARETPQGPKEALRCRLSNTYDTKTLTLAVSGRCAAAGRKVNMSGTLQGTKGSDVLSGRWMNPDGAGSVRLRGVVKGKRVAFTFKAKDPNTGRDLAQNVEWVPLADGLHLRSTDRAQPDITMSDVKFTR